MGRVNTFRDIGDRKRLKAASNSSPDVSAVKGGRVSVADSTGTIGGLLRELSTIEPDFNIEILKALNYLAKYHGDFSYAVDNIKQLGNTKYNIYFDDTVSTDLQKEMLLRIKTKSKDWYAYSGGINSMIGDLLAQIAINGALSAECVIMQDLKGVKKSIMLNPSKVRFKYDVEADEYAPYQLVSNSLGYKGTLVDGNLIGLNTLTYKYIALGRFDEKPYGLPPFMSALENIAIGKDMQDNLKHVVKKLGTLGFLEVLLNAPKAKANESDDDYYRRTQKYLDQVIPEIDKGLAKGYVAGFKDVHEFNMHNTATNVTGTKDLVEINDTKMMSGLKQDPLMFGRNFSTTETLGRVILAKMGTQVGSYQKIIASYLETMFLLDLQLSGYPIQTLDVEFDPPMIGDKQRDEETRAKTLANLDTLLGKGIIDINQYAVEAGYEKPADPEKHKINPFSPDPDKDPEEDLEDDPVGDEDVTDPKTTAVNNKFMANLSKGVTRLFDYGSTECCGTVSFDKIDDDLAFFIKNYYTATADQYGKAINKASKKIANELAKLDGMATEQEVLDSVMYYLYKDWDGTFKKPQAKIIGKFVTAAYEFFRKDKVIFGDAGKIPKALMDVVDFRAIEYFKKSDDLYLGKFITDPDTRKKMTQFIKDQYLAGDLPIGNNKESIDIFRESFGKLMFGEEWKIQRIINTTTSKLRSTAAVKYMEQAMVTQYEVRGVNDRLQCAYCSNLQGKTFSVDKAVRHVEQYTISDPAYVPLDSPFVNSVFKNPDDLLSMTGDELQARGLHITPFHANCRDTLVAIL